MNKFEEAKNKIAEMISSSDQKTDPGHSLNTLEWLLKLKPDADEILQLSALAHDIERGRLNRLRLGEFDNYDAFKSAHALQGAEMAKQIALEAGYSEAEANRLYEIIKHHETGNNDEDTNLVMDADSISYFDFNIEEYLKDSGEEATKNKILFMRNRASKRAKSIIDEIIKNKPKLNILFV